MPTQQPSTTETAKEKVANGMWWGLGFALVATPVAGALGLLWHAITKDEKNPYKGLSDDEKDDLYRGRLRRMGITDEGLIDAAIRGEEDAYMEAKYADEE